VNGTSIPDYLSGWLSNLSIFGQNKNRDTNIPSPMGVNPLPVSLKIRSFVPNLFEDVEPRRN
jgi:hypothetical protein